MNRDEKLELVHKIFYSKTHKNLWFELLCAEAKEHSIILEIGSGSGKGKQNTDYPKAMKIVGIDLDARVLENPHLDEAYHANAYALGEVITNTKFDLIYSHMVAEHIDDGKKFVGAQLEFLKNGGKLLHSTVSKYYWTSFINDFVPVRIKNLLIQTLGSGRNAEDIFPAHYKLNSETDIKNICEELSLNYEIIRQDEPPGYLRRSIILMLFYTILHRPLQCIIPPLRPTFIFKLWRA